MKYRALDYLRFEIWDDMGCLRKFQTKAEAQKFIQDDTWLVIKPRPKKPSRNLFINSSIEKYGEALF